MATITVKRIVSGVTKPEVININEFADVSNTNPTNLQVLKYYANTGVWTPTDVDSTTVKVSDIGTSVQGYDVDK